MDTPNPRHRSELHVAVENEDLHRVMGLINLGHDTNVAESGGRQLSPLHTAVLCGNADNALTLLMCGADPDVYDAYGRTPMDWVEICLGHIYLEQYEAEPRLRELQNLQLIHHKLAICAEMSPQERKQKMIMEQYAILVHIASQRR